MPVLISDIKIETHPSMIASDAVIQISRDFMHQHNLNHFAYVRRYPDSGGFCLTTHPQMSVDYYENEFYKVTDFEVDYSAPPSATFLWMAANEKERRLFNHAKENYDFSHGITLIHNHDDFQEQLYFATSIDNYSANNFYINNLDLLENFGKTFIEKSFDIIQQCSEERILLPSRESLGSHDPFRHSLKSTDPLCSPHSQLSPREAQLLHLLATGLSCKTIANQLDLKVKTIYFYLENIKHKLGLNNRDDLVTYYWKKY